MDSMTINLGTNQQPREYDIEYSGFATVSCADQLEINSIRTKNGREIDIMKLKRENQIKLVNLVIDKLEEHGELCKKYSF